MRFVSKNLKKLVPRLFEKLIEITTGATPNRPKIEFYSGGICTRNFVQTFFLKIEIIGDCLLCEEAEYEELSEHGRLMLMTDRPLVLLFLNGLNLSPFNAPNRVLFPTPYVIH